METSEGYLVSQLWHERDCNEYGLSPRCSALRVALWKQSRVHSVSLQVTVQRAVEE